MSLGIAAVVLVLLLVVLVVLLPPEINGGPPRAFVTDQELRICAQHVVHAVIKGAAVDTLIPLVEGQVDLWGNELRMRVEQSVLHIESRGEDGAWGTSDDVVVKQVLPR